MKEKDKKLRSLHQKMELLHQQIEETLFYSPLITEEKMAVIMRFNYSLLRACQCSTVQMTIADGSKLVLKLELPPPLAH
ncbi:hypothetical protein [Erwinia sorbitola]|uniref:Uncharacterized protein n=1 Tax=Erwinia sorbitola TaxID=2681984 RepID=A0A6I6E7F7_9GAMM|nr:hypothetical protein [Erwinia sorbitola]MTD28016.1 hypothetical protein [Erwinia sorbitola]QGU85714.1 hypothetical protein GN242_00100 [Erwinia sorbitola]